MTTANLAQPSSKYLEDFRESKQLQKNSAVQQLRQQAIENFERLGFPTTKNEEWKYTNLKPVIAIDRIAAVIGNTLRDTDELKIPLPFIDAIVVVLENGFLNEKISTIQNIPQGLIIKNISNCSDEAFFIKHYAKYGDQEVDACCALNTAFANEGVFIHIDKNCQLDKPIYLVNYTTTSNDELITYPRCLVVAEKGSKSAIEWLTVSPGRMRASAFVNAVNEIVVEENARLDFCILQNDHQLVSQVCNTYAYQEANSHFNINTITTGGNLVRNKLHIKLDGLNVETHLFGLSMGGGHQLIDHHTAVFHAKPHCFSNQLYKGIMDGASQGVFNGKIMVMKDAQKTNAFQSNKNILLSDDASMFAKPQLEIFADDVKCSHGATTGQIDEEALFYLRSRGIGIERAKSLLNVAFAADVINNIPNEPLRNYIMGLIENKLVVQNN